MVVSGPTASVAREGGYCVFGPVDAVACAGIEMNCVACITPCPIGVGIETRNGTSTRVPPTGASQTSISRCETRYLIAVRVGTKPATGTKYTEQTTAGPS